MSRKTNRANLNKANNRKEYRCILFNELYPDYWDDGINFYPKYRRGFKNPNKTITRWEMRSYRSWKYNRKTKYK